MSESFLLLRDRVGVALHGQDKFGRLIDRHANYREDPVVESVLYLDDAKMPVDLFKTHIVRGGQLRFETRKDGFRGGSRERAPVFISLLLLGEQSELAQAELDLLVPELLLASKAEADQCLGRGVDILLLFHIVYPRDLGQLRRSPL